MGTSEHNAGGNPVMDWDPIHGVIEMLVASTEISGLKDYLARLQTTLTTLT